MDFTKPANINEGNPIPAPSSSTCLSLIQLGLFSNTFTRAIDEGHNLAQKGKGVFGSIFINEA